MIRIQRALPRWEGFLSTRLVFDAVSTLDFSSHLSCTFPVNFSAGGWGNGAHPTRGSSHPPPPPFLSPPVSLCVPASHCCLPPWKLYPQGSQGLAGGLGLANPWLFPSTLNGEPVSQAGPMGGLHPVAAGATSAFPGHRACCPATHVQVPAWSPSFLSVP